MGGEGARGWGRRWDDVAGHAGRANPIVTIVIVNFNGGRLLTQAVQSVLASTIPVEVVLADNHSTDDSVQRLRSEIGAHPNVHIVENDRNLGFARASNAAIAQARGEFILLLNPDAIVGPDTLAHMIRTVEAYPEAGMAGCLLRNPDGSEQAGCRRNVPTPWRTTVRMLRLDRLLPNHPRFRNFVLAGEGLPDKPEYLEAISGAFMLVRRAALEQVGVLDEGYFLHCEDLDWCMRFRQAGWKILFVPDVEVVHYKGACSVDRPIRVLWHKHRGMVRFYRKFFRQQYPYPLMLMTIAAVWCRFSMLAVGAFVRGGRFRPLVPDRHPGHSVGPPDGSLPREAAERNPTTSLHTMANATVTPVAGRRKTDHDRPAVRL